MSTVEARDYLAQRDDVARSSRVAMEKLKRELQHAYLTKNTGAVNTYQTVFVGTNDDPDKLIFATLAHQRLYRNTRECDQTEVSVWVEPAADRDDGYVLYHREAPRIDEKPDEGGKVLPLAYNVRSFEVRYLDSLNGEWVTTWDSRNVDNANRLPRAVQLALVLMAPDPDDPEHKTVDVPFVTTVALQYAQPLVRSAFNQDQVPTDAGQRRDAANQGGGAGGGGAFGGGAGGAGGVPNFGGLPRQGGGR
jgi:general secretion pathway protein J